MFSEASVILSKGEGSLHPGGLPMGGGGPNQKNGRYASYWNAFLFFRKSYNVAIFQSNVKNVEDNYKMGCQFDINILYDASESLGAVIT